jgi:hypothetical protein
MSITASFQTVLVFRQSQTLIFLSEVVAALLPENDIFVFQKRVQVSSTDTVLSGYFCWLNTEAASAVQLFESVGDDLVGFVEYFFFIL